ncbi:restriction endonuclease subunit S [bacterium 1XD21-13]|nr:restriction endonuclease subunit S [bacterium 1XD21-13]
MIFEKIKLKDVCISISDGDHQAPPKANRGVPFVTISNITNTNQFDFSNTMFVPQEYYNSLDSKRKAKEGDILYSVVGSFGIPVYIKTDTQFVFQRHIAILRPNRDKIVPEFLYYTMLNRDFYMKADAAAIGAAQRTVSLTALRNMEIEIPHIETQKKIAKILSSYDNLIDNNQKQIKLLEEAAQRLYKEWFVDLRFPGYEDVKIVDGVPEGWRKGRADSFFNITIGKTPPRAEKQWFVKGDAGVPWLSISDMGNARIYAFATSEALTQEAIKKHNMKIVPSGTILVSFKLTVGRVSIAATDMCTNEAIAHFYIENDLQQAYTFCYLNNFKYDSLGNTSSISKAVNSKIIKAMPFVMPDKATILAFSKLVVPILNEIKNKQATCIKLAEARDRLLPKLMCGEIEV